MSTYNYGTFTAKDANGVEHTFSICTFIPDGKGIEGGEYIVEPKEEKEKKEESDEV